MANKNKIKRLQNLGTYEWLSQKYYKRPFADLNPQLKDKVITWASNWNPNYGSSKDRRHGRTLGRYIIGKI
jgi:hypothetical protein